jgi:hypothetical protein
MTESAVSMDDLSAYCREVEAHLCRRNGGHLIRVVGPAFELVKGWAETGVPLTVVKDGIDRTVDRAARKTSPRRRPVQLEFCAADVLEGFDRWRRAVGVATAAPATTGGGTRGSLAAHVERVSRELTAQLLRDRAGPGLRAAIEAALVAVTEMSTRTASARGAARESVLARLSALDATIVDAAVSDLTPDRLRALQEQAEGELAPFKTRLDAAAWASAVLTARRRAVRLALGLPTLSFE